MLAYLWDVGLIGFEQKLELILHCGFGKLTNWSTWSHSSPSLCLLRRRRARRHIHCGLDSCWPYILSAAI